MYVRLKSDNSGRLYLQQLLTFSEKGKVVNAWENVKTLGVVGIEAHALPIGKLCGMFCLDVNEPFYKADHSLEWRREFHFFSALDVESFHEESNETNSWLKINVRDKRRFKVKMDRLEFCFLLTDLLTNFKIVKFDINGNLIQGDDHGESKEETSAR